jgi:hydroxymethylbilane synthase
LKKIRIGTTSTPLTLWQAQLVKKTLENQGFETELVVVDVKNGLDSDEIEASLQNAELLGATLLRGDVDMAVHPLKYLPTTQPEGLAIAGVGHRANPAEVLLIRPGAVDSQLFKMKPGAVVGTSSARQKAQLNSYRPGLQFVDIRGELPTQLEKLRKGDFDALLATAVDLSRLQLDVDGLTLVNLNVKEFVPAPGQGVLAYRCCTGDLETRAIINQFLHEPDVAAVTNVERRVLKILGGAPHLALGAYCERDANGNYHIWAALADAWDLPVRRTRLSQSTHLGLAERVVAGLGA